MKTEKMREINRKLQLLDFEMVRNKPFLFRKNFRFTHDCQEHTIIFFADMRAKENPWMDLPVCWTWDPNDAAPSWLVNRIEKHQLEIFQENGILSSDSTDFDCEDGFCKACGANFMDDGWYCPDCTTARELKHIEQLREKYVTISDICLCGAKLTKDGFLLNEFRKYEIGPAKELVLHHTSYNSNRTMPVCASCHNRIEHSSDPEFAKYRAKDKRPGRVRKTVDTVCFSCGENMRVLKDEYQVGQSYDCYRCQIKKKRERNNVERGHPNQFVPRQMSWYERKALEAKFGRG
jgi:hypothetical protein